MAKTNGLGWTTLEGMSHVPNWPNSEDYETDEAGADGVTRGADDDCIACASRRIKATISPTVHRVNVPTLPLAGPMRPEGNKMALTRPEGSDIVKVIVGNYAADVVAADLLEAVKLIVAEGDPKP